RVRPAPGGGHPARRTPGPVRAAGPRLALHTSHARRPAGPRAQQLPVRTPRRHDRRRTLLPDLHLQPSDAGGPPRTCAVTLATLSPTCVLGLPTGHLTAPEPQLVGPGWEVLLMPARLAHLARRTFARSTAS